ncbi:hypothetical protein TeGR_g1454 [Tetraparma gracilis]|uniref:Methyltransferase small domain-containing protein n=1 Tax=Tetraparma gracilis TaxID=2962635 RepID=A0ABQ6MM93_9STRA|nr:hypothetical protein TeGR_g1454 [Tetraparma gracilis]
MENHQQQLVPHSYIPTFDTQSLPHFPLHLSLHPPPLPPPSSKREAILRRSLPSPPSAHLLIEQARETDGRGGTGLGFGAAVYPAAVCLSLLISSPYFHLLPPSAFSAGVVDLGAGTGVVGLAVAARHSPPPPFRVVVTDGDEKSCGLIASNIRGNRSALKGEAVPGRLLWGNREDENACVAAAGGRISLVVMSDVAALVYREYFGDLVDTVARFAEDGAVCLFSYQPREVAVEAEFFRGLEGRGVSVERVGNEHLHPDFIAVEETRIEVFLARSKARSS